MFGLRRIAIAVLIVCLVGGSSLLIPEVRSQARTYARNVLRPEPPAPITPIALYVPESVPSAIPAPTDPPPPPVQPTLTAPPATAVDAPSAVSTATVPPPPTVTSTPEPSPTPAQVTVNGRVYDAYLPAATKDAQAYQYSCEFDAVWVILQTYGIDVSVDELIAVTPQDTSIEPYIEETPNGFIIHGGDITTTFSGDYTANYLARSTGAAMTPVFANYDLAATPVNDRASIEAALRSGSLVWMKTTVDFKPWRPATWVMPDGRTHQTVLGNDHAVVVMGFNQDVVVIRDVLGPTSSNWQRPYEYEVDWGTFMAAWEAQSFDALAVAPPGSGV